MTGRVLFKDFHYYSRDFSIRYQDTHVHIHAHADIEQLISVLGIDVLISIM